MITRDGNDWREASTGGAGGFHWRDDDDSNAVAPGPTETELFFEGKSDEMVERMKKLSPMERLGQPEEIAAVVAFLASPDGGWVNGQTIRANGGTV